MLVNVRTGHDIHRETYTFETFPSGLFVKILLPAVIRYVGARLVNVAIWTDPESLNMLEGGMVEALERSELNRASYLGFG